MTQGGRTVPTLDGETETLKASAPTGGGIANDFRRVDVARRSYPELRKQRREKDEHTTSEVTQSLRDKLEKTVETAAQEEASRDLRKKAAAISKTRKQGRRKLARSPSSSSSSKTRRRTRRRPVPRRCSRGLASQGKRSKEAKGRRGGAEQAVQGGSARERRLREEEKGGFMICSRTCRQRETWG